ncbi:uncharacterized protein DS421_3g89120 [Arachis hypogaea]|nr:uncharacterized protein DS421_3g89120 [Arachis hypogaea]
MKNEDVAYVAVNCMCHYDTGFRLCYLFKCLSSPKAYKWMIQQPWFGFISSRLHGAPVKDFLDEAFIIYSHMIEVTNLTLACIIPSACPCKQTRELFKALPKTS